MMPLQVVQSADGFVVSIAPAPSSPATVRTSYVAEIVEIVKAVYAMYEEDNFERWQRDVSEKLDRIIQKLDEVLDEIRRMKVWMDERITEESRRVLSRRIRSISSDLNNIV